MLAGKLVGVHPLPITVQPGAGALALTGYAPTASVSVSYNTLSLNHFNGTDAATTFTDEVGGVTWSTDTGSPELDTANKKFGSASLRCIRAGGVNAAIKSSALDIDETGSWTLEGWFFLTSVGRGAIQIFESSFLFERVKIVASLDGNNVIACVIGKVTSNDIMNYVNLSAGLSASTWYHWAAVRDVVAGTYSFYFNGNREDVVSSALDAGGDDNLSIIRVQEENTSNGHGIQHDDVRFTDAVQYSGATYTVPSAEFSV